MRVDGRAHRASCCVAYERSCAFARLCGGRCAGRDLWTARRFDDEDRQGAGNGVHAHQLPRRRSPRPGTLGVRRRPPARVLHRAERARHRPGRSPSGQSRRGWLQAVVLRVALTLIRRPSGVAPGASRLVRRAIAARPRIAFGPWQALDEATRERDGKQCACRVARSGLQDSRQRRHRISQLALRYGPRPRLERQPAWPSIARAMVVGDGYRRRRHARREPCRRRRRRATDDGGSVVVA